MHIALISATWHADLLLGASDGNRTHQVVRNHIRESLEGREIMCALKRAGLSETSVQVRGKSEAQPLDVGDRWILRPQDAACSNPRHAARRLTTVRDGHIESGNGT